MTSKERTDVLDEAVKKIEDEINIAKKLNPAFFLRYMEGLNKAIEIIRKGR